MGMLQKAIAAPHVCYKESVLLIKQRHINTDEKEILTMDFVYVRRHRCNRYLSCSGILF